MRMPCPFSPSLRRVMVFLRVGLLAGAALSAAPAGAGIVNGDFSQAPPTAFDPPPGWDDFFNGAGWQPNGGPDDSPSYVLEGAIYAVLEQLVGGVVPLQAYILEFDYRFDGTNDQNGNISALQLSFMGVQAPYQFTYHTALDDFAWHHAAVSFTPNFDQFDMQLRDFLSDRFVLDNFTLAPAEVPEPASALLLIGSLLALRRRRSDP